MTDDKRLTSDGCPDLVVPDDIMRALLDLREFRKDLNELDPNRIWGSNDPLFKAWLDENKVKADKVIQYMTSINPEYPQVHRDLREYHNTRIEMHQQGRSPRDIDDVPVPYEAPDWAIALAEYTIEIDMAYLSVLPELQPDGTPEGRPFPYGQIDFRNIPPNSTVRRCKK